MMKHYFWGLLIVFATSSNNSVQSQSLSFGITGNLGASKVGKRLDASSKAEYVFSGNGGLVVEKQLTTKSAFGAEVLWVQIEGKEGRQNHKLYIFNGQTLQEYGVINDEAGIHIGYLGIPVYYRHAIGPLGVKCGIQTRLVVFANSEYFGQGVVNGNIYISQSKTKGMQLDQPVDIGPKMGLDLQIIPNLRIRMDYYCNLNRITHRNDLTKLRNEQLTIGIDYFFYKTKGLFEFASLGQKGGFYLSSKPFYDKNEKSRSV